jgi:hypothetical protein
MLTPGGSFQQPGIYGSSMYPAARAEDIFSIAVQQQLSTPSFAASPSKTPLQKELEEKIDRLKSEHRLLASITR